MKLISSLDIALIGFVKYVIYGNPTIHKDFLTYEEFNQNLFMCNIKNMSTSIDEHQWITENYFIFISEPSDVTNKNVGWKLSEIKSLINNICYDPKTGKYFVTLPKPYVMV